MKLKDVVGRIWAIWGAIVLIITMLLTFPLYLIGYLLKEPRAARWHKRISQIWVGMFLPLAGCPLRVKNKHYFDKNTNYIVVCNHNSLMDPLVSTPYIPHANKTIAKKSFAKVPILGTIYTLGSVLIDRKSAESRKKGYDDMKNVLQVWKLDMVIYPEGTRNTSNEPLRPFHDGAFKLAIDTNKPIMPAIIFNTKKALSPHKPFFFLPYHLEMHFLHPVSPEGKTADALKKEVFDLMYNYYKENDAR